MTKALRTFLQNPSRSGAGGAAHNKAHMQPRCHVPLLAPGQKLAALRRAGRHSALAVDTTNLVNTARGMHGEGRARDGSDRESGGGEGGTTGGRARKCQGGARETPRTNTTETHTHTHTRAHGPTEPKMGACHKRGCTYTACPRCRPGGRKRRTTRGPRAGCPHSRSRRCRTEGRWWSTG